MTTLDPRTLHTEAQERLDAAHTDPRRLVLIHTGLVLLLSLLGNGLSLFLDSQISTTGGLSGLGTRSFLQTLQALISYSTMLFTPFWSAGFLLVAIRWATNAPAKPRDLLSGFRRFTAVLAYQLLLTVGVFLLAQPCFYIASFIFALTPYAEPMLELLEPVLTSGSLDALESISMEAVWNVYTPMLIIFAVIMIPITIVLSYYLRLSQYFIMDAPGTGGFRSALLSFKAMGGHVLQMVRLDLHFWWYYLLEVLLTVICYLDYLLPMLGFTLPVDSTAAYFITLVVYSILEIALHLWKKAEIDTTYALAYRRIITPPQAIYSEPQK